MSTENPRIVVTEPNSILRIAQKARMVQSNLIKAIETLPEAEDRLDENGQLVSSDTPIIFSRGNTTYEIYYSMENNKKSREEKATSTRDLIINQYDSEEFVGTHIKRSSVALSSSGVFTQQGVRVTRGRCSVEINGENEVNTINAFDAIPGILIDLFPRRNK